MNLCLLVGLLCIFSTAAVWTKVLFFFSKNKCTFNSVKRVAGLLALVYSFLDFIHFFFFTQAVVGPNYSDRLSCVLLKKCLCACLYFQLQALVIARHLCAELPVCASVGCLPQSAWRSPRLCLVIQAGHHGLGGESSCFCTKRIGFSCPENHSE